MLTVWVAEGKGLRSCAKDPVEGVVADLQRGLWIDLVDMTSEEEKQVEAVVGFDLPSRAEMQEIEASSRLYREGEATVMTATMLIKTETGSPESTAVTFILTPDRLVTIRHAEPWSFRTFAQRAPKSAVASAEQVFIALMDTTVERLADMLELVAMELDHLSHQVFRRSHAARGPRVDLQKAILKLGSCGHICGKVRESLTDKSRISAYADKACEWLSSDARSRLRSISHDIQTLSDHAGFTNSKINFLLDATLGLINNNVNQEMKRMSAIMIAVMWPALVSGFFAMNVALPFPGTDTGKLWPFFLCVALAFGPLLVGGAVWWRRMRRG